MGTSPRIAISSIVGIVAFAVLLFVPAGTVSYWQGWAFLAVFSVASLGPTLYLGRKYPEVVERRAHAGVNAETRPVQKVVIAGTFVVFAAMLVVPAWTTASAGRTCLRGCRLPATCWWPPAWARRCGWWSRITTPRPPSPSRRVNRW